MPPKKRTYVKRTAKAKVADTAVPELAQALHIPTEKVSAAAEILNHARETEQKALVKMVETKFDTETLDLFDSYDEAMRQGAMSKKLLNQLHRMENQNQGNDIMTRDLMAKLHAKLPALTKNQKNVLHTHEITLLDKPRAVHYEVAHTNCETFLSLYSFSTTDTGPFFPIKELYFVLEKQLRKLGASWEDVESFPKLRNPVHKKGIDVPEYLDVHSAQRIHKWYRCFNGYCQYLQSLKPFQRTHWEKFDLVLFPLAVSQHDQTIMTRWYSLAHSAKNWTLWAVKNQFMIMVFRNILCIGVALFFAMYLGRSINAIQFLLDLLLGQFLEDMWRYWTQMIAWAGLKWLDLSSLGPMGTMLTKFFQLMLGIGAKNMLTAGAVAGVGLFGGGWIAGFAFLGVQESFFKSLGLGSISEIMLVAAATMYDLFVTSVVRDAGSISTLFAIHGVKYVCTLMGFPADGWCQAFADRISYAIQGISVGVMLFDIISDIRFLGRLYMQPNLTLAELEAMGRDLSCIRALYGWKRSPSP